MSRITVWGSQCATLVLVAVALLLAVGQFTTAPAGAGIGDAVDLAPPEILKSNGATLEWSRYTGPSGAPFDRYEVHRSETAGFTPSASTLLTTIRDIDETSYADTTADAARPFSYKVVANTSASNEVRPTLPLAGRTRLELQPAAQLGKASYLQKSSVSGPSCVNHGSSATMFLGTAGGEANRPVLQFNLRDMPANANVTEATLSLYRQAAAPAATTVDVHRLRSEWDEGTSTAACGVGVSWDEPQPGVTWDAKGGDLGTAAASTSIAAGAAAGVDTFDIKPVVQDWSSAVAPNHGLLLKAHDETTAPSLNYVADDSTALASQRPKLVVKYDDSSSPPLGPTVEFRSIEDGALVSGAAVPIDVEAGDDRRVERVEFYLDGALIGSDTTTPWSMTWDSRTASYAAHSLKAKAIDDVGNAGSETITVTAANSAAPTAKITAPSSTYADMIKAAQPAAYWRLGEASGATAADASGNGQTGALAGTYLRAQAGLLVGDVDKSTALQNATTDGKLTAPLAGKLGTSLTAETWVNYAGTATAGAVNRVISRGYGAAGGWLLGLTKGSDGVQRALFSVNAGGTEYKATAAVTPGKLHLAGRFTGTDARLFVNGADVASVAVPAVALNTTASVTVGGTLNDNVTVDEVALYGAALDAAAFPMHYEVGAGRTPLVSGNAIDAASDASDDRGVDKVQFFVDGNYIGTDTSAPFTDDIHTTIAGREIYNGVHDLTSRAYDAEGQLKEAATQTFRVDNSGGTTAYNATFKTTSATPSEVTFVPAPATPVVSAFNVDVTNTGTATWPVADVVLRPRWIAPDGTITEQTEVSLGSDLPAGQTRNRTIKVTPPQPPDGTTKAQFALRVDVYRKSTSTFFASKGNGPLDKPVMVHKTGGDLGLEDWLQYDGEELGGGMQHLVNLASANSLVHMTPMSSTGRGLSTEMELTYNSLEDRSESPLGDNWSLSISGLTRLGTPLDVHPNSAENLGGNPPSRYIDLTDADGTVHRFVGKSNGSTVYWEEPAGVHLFLRATGSADPARYWAITRPDGVTFYYDVDGYPTSVEDKNANRITYTLQTVPPGEDPGGQKKRITAVTDASGRSYTIDYYAKNEAPKPRIRGRIESITDHSGAAPGPAGTNTLRFEYYDDGNLRRISQVGGRRATGAAMADRNWFFTYTTSDGSGPAIPAAADRDVPDSHTPNQSTRLFSVRDPRHNETTFTYRGPGGGQQRWQLTSRTSRAGKTTSFAYDTATRTTTVSAPLARTWRYTFDGNDQVTRITNPLNENTDVTWSADRHVASVTTPMATGTAQRAFTYNQNGQLSSYTNEQGEKTVLTYDDLPVPGGADISGLWKAGRTVGHLSRLASKTAPRGVDTPLVADDYQWTFGYDSPTSLGNLVRITDPEKKSTVLVPNPDGTFNKVTDPNGNWTSYEYDASGQPRKVSEFVSATETRVTQFGYDADGFLIWLQDPAHAGETAADTRSYRTYFDYDTWHRPGRESTPKSTATDRGQLIWTQRRHNGNDSVEKSFGPHYARQWFRGGALTEVSYDTMDRPERTFGPDSEVDPQGERWRFSYDDAGRLEQATDPRGMFDLTSDQDGTTTFKYDVLDRLVRTARNEVEGTTVVRTLYRHNCYDKAGDLVATTPSIEKDNVVCASLVDADDKPTRYTYDKAHRVLSRTLPGKLPQRVTYDRNGNVETTTDEANVTVTRSYDQRDLPIRIVTPFNAAKQLIARRQYDAGGRLVIDASPRAVDHLGDRGNYAETEDYVTSYAYNGADEVTRLRLAEGPTLPGKPDLPPHYVHRRYDPNGNLTTITQPVAGDTFTGSEPKTIAKYFDTGWIRSLDRTARRRVKYGYTAEGWQDHMTPKLADGTDDTAHERSWKYYLDGMLREELDGENRALDTYKYNANDALTSALDSSGLSKDTEQHAVELNVSYDSLDRPTRVSQTDSASVADAADRNVTTMAYWPSGMLKERVENRVETSAGAEVKPGQRHVFDYDTADWLKTQTDYNTPADTTPERIVENLYKPTGQLEQRKVTKSGTLRQSIEWSYFLNGDLQTMVTKAGSPLAVTESHTNKYLENGDSGAYVNGNRTRDVWRRTSPKTGAPCRTTDCTTTYTYDPRDRLLQEVRDRDGVDLDRTTTFTLTPSGSVDTSDGVEGTLRTLVDNDYTGEQLKHRTVTQTTTTTPSSSVTDEFSYWPDPSTGDLECVTKDPAPESVCDYSNGASAEAGLVEFYAYDDDSKLRSSYQWDPGHERGADPTSVARFDYDPLDRPVTEREHHPAKWSEARLTKFSYIGTTDQVSQEQQFKIGAIDTPTSSATLSETKSYSYDPRGWRVSLIDVKKGEPAGRGFAPDETKSYLYGYDPHNNVSQLLNETGVVRAAYGYTVYGTRDEKETAELANSGTPGGDPSQFTDEFTPVNPYRYAGKRLDTGTGQLDMGARRFAPTTAQFLQEDVLKDALGDLGLGIDALTRNRYSLAGGNPVSFIESDGHMPIAESGYTAAKIRDPDADRAEDGPPNPPKPPFVQPTDTDTDSSLGREPGEPNLRTLTKEEQSHPDPPGAGEGLGPWLEGLDWALTFTGGAGAVKKVLMEGLEFCVRKCLGRAVAGGAGRSANEAHEAGRAAKGGRTFRSGSSGGGGGGISLEQAAAAAKRQGIDMRMFELRYEAGSDAFGFMSQTGAGDLIRGSTGRIALTLKDPALATERAAVETIAHELNHVRGVMRSGSVTDEALAEAAAQAAGRYFRP